jgi:surfactin synthase thioesterase subunit
MAVLAGRADQGINPAQVEGRLRETDDTCHIDWFHGGHFFIDEQRESVLACLNRVAGSL